LLFSIQEQILTQFQVIASINPFNPYDNLVWVCRTYPQYINNHNIKRDLKTKDLLDAVPRSQNLRKVYKPRFADKVCAFAALFEAQHFQKFFHSDVTQFEMGLCRCPGEIRTHSKERDSQSNIFSKLTNRLSYKHHNA